LQSLSIEFVALGEIILKRNPWSESENSSILQNDEPPQPSLIWMTETESKQSMQRNSVLIFFKISRKTFHKLEEIKATAISSHNVQQICEVWNYPRKYNLFIKGYNRRNVYYNEIKIYYMIILNACGLEKGKFSCLRFQVPRRDLDWLSYCILASIFVVDIPIVLLWYGKASYLSAFLNRISLLKRKYTTTNQNNIITMINDRAQL